MWKDNVLESELFRLLYPFGTAGDGSYLAGEADFTEGAGFPGKGAVTSGRQKAQRRRQIAGRFGYLQAAGDVQVDVTVRECNSTFGLQNSENGEESVEIPAHHGPSWSSKVTL